MGPFNSIRDVTAALFRRFWLIVLVVIAGCIASVVFALSRPKLFEAVAVIQIEAPQVTETLASPASAAFSGDSELDLIQQKLMARDQLVGMIEDFGLFPAVPSMTERVALLRGAATIAKLVDPAQAWRPDVQPSGLIITVRLDNSEDAAAVANEFLARILDEATRRTEGRAARTVEFLTAEETRIATSITETSDTLARLKEANAASLPEAMTSQRDRLSRLGETRLAIERDLIAIQNASDRLRAEEVARQSEQLTQQIAAIDRDIAEIEAAIAAAPEVERRIAAVERELTLLQDQFTIITTRRTEAEMTQLLEMQDQAERFVVLETAIPPEFPISASRKKLALAGAVASVLAAVGLALGLELIGGSIRTAAQLERQLGVKPVVVIPNLTTRTTRRRRRGLIALILAALAALLLWGQGAGQGLVDRIGALPRQRAAGS